MPTCKCTNLLLKVFVLSQVLAEFRCCKSSRANPISFGLWSAKNFEYPNLEVRIAHLCYPQVLHKLDVYDRDYICDLLYLKYYRKIAIHFRRHRLSTTHLLLVGQNEKKNLPSPGHATTFFAVSKYSTESSSVASIFDWGINVKMQQNRKIFWWKLDRFIMNRFICLLC